MNEQKIQMSGAEQKQVMLNILDTFANFCEENGFSYFLDAGTLIGAVRHKGYIPWDDDIDVNMPRMDLDRFVQYIQSRNGWLSEHLRVEFPIDTLYPFLKISDDRTVLMEFPEKYPMEVSVYIDVFAKDGILDDTWKSKLICKLSEFLWLVHWFNHFSIYAWRNDSYIFKRCIAAVGRCCNVAPNLAIRLQDKLIHWNQKKHPIDRCKYVTTLTNGEFHKIAPKECFSDYIMMDFEDKKFRVPVGYDTYLRCLYPGDYMQVPPEDKREHHNTIVYWKSEQDKQDFYRSIQ